MKDKLFLYHFLSSLPVKLSYPAKLKVFAFLGIHIPLLAMVAYIAISSELSNWLEILLVALLATLAGTAITLVIIHMLLRPVRLIADALYKFTKNRELPALPTQYEDEMGKLMEQTQLSLEEIDSYLMIKNNLLSIISHDTKTPIGSIEMSCGLMEEELEQDQPDIEELKELTKLIRISNQDQDNIIRDMITLARFEEKEIELDKEVVDPEQIVKKIRSTFALYFRQKKIDFSASVEENVKNLYLDKEKIQVVLNNLIQNAIKFTASGGEVSLKLSSENNSVIFTLSDTGTGIPEEKLSDIFEPYFGTTEGTNKEKGMGLGLWIANTFVKLHDGSIIVESKPGKGSVFTVIIPQN